MSAGQSGTMDHDPTRPAQTATLDWKLIVIPVVIVALALGVGLAIHSRVGTSTAGVAQSRGGAMAPDFTVATVNGPRFVLAAQRGHPVLLFFMASNCTSCLLESNALGRVQKKYGGRVRIVLVDIGPGDNPEALRTFVQRSAGPSRYWVLDSSGKVATAYGVQSLDVTFVVDRQGHIVYKNALPLGYNELEREVARVA